MSTYWMSDKSYRDHPKIWKENRTKQAFGSYLSLAILFLETRSFSVLFTKSQETICQQEKEKTGMNNK